MLAAAPGCVTTLVEPNPHCHDVLAATGCELHRVAASDQPGEASLNLTREWLQSTGASLYRENTDFFRDDVLEQVSVPRARLDDLFPGRRFDFIKIDTQGSELDVLRGGEAVLRQADHVLIEISLVEFNQGGATPEAVFAAMAGLGFRPARVTEFHRLRGVRDGGLLQIDVLFERGGAARHAAGLGVGRAVRCRTAALAGRPSPARTGLARAEAGAAGLGRAAVPCRPAWPVRLRAVRHA